MNARHFGLREYSSCRSAGSENTAITGGMALLAIKWSSTFGTSIFST